MSKYTAAEDQLIIEMYNDPEDPKTIKQIADALPGRSPSSVRDHLKVLRKQGLVAYRRGSRKQRKAEREQFIINYKKHIPEEVINYLFDNVDQEHRDEAANAYINQGNICAYTGEPFSLEPDTPNQLAVSKNQDGTTLMWKAVSDLKAASPFFLSVAELVVQYMGAAGIELAGETSSD